MKRLLSVIGWTCCGLMSAMAAQPHTVLLGTYTSDRSEGIYAVQLDPQSGAMSPAVLVKAMPDPEFLARHPAGRIVYALTREDSKNGGVVALAVDPESGRLTELNRRMLTGGTFCHLAVDPTGRRLLAVSYGGGFTTHWALDDAGRLAEGGEIIPHSGPPGPHEGRQQAPHAHSVTISPQGDFALVADLGLDRVLAYALTGVNRTVEVRPENDVIIPAGSGPRHSAFSPSGDSFYVLNELNGTVTGFTYAAAEGTLQQAQHVSMLLPEYEGPISASEIRVHPNGRFVYAANRGDNTLVTFARDETTGELTRRGAVAAGGRNPRNFALSPDGRWLLCASQDSHLLTSFRVDATTGTLTPTGSAVDVPRAVCVLFLPDDAT